MDTSASHKRRTGSKFGERKLSAKYGRNGRGGLREWSDQYKEKEDD